MQSKRRPFHRSISLLARLSITRSTRASPGSVLKKKRAMLVAVLFFVRVRPSVLPGNAALSKCQLPMPRLGRFAAPIMFRRNAPSVRPCDRSNLAALVSHTKSFSASFVIIYGPSLSLSFCTWSSLPALFKREQLLFVLDSLGSLRIWELASPLPAQMEWKRKEDGARSERVLRQRACVQSNGSPNLMTRAGAVAKVCITKYRQASVFHLLFYCLAAAITFAHSINQSSHAKRVASLGSCT